MDSENKKELLSLIFDSDIIYQITYNMSVNALNKPYKLKQEEDLYIIDKNLGEINAFLSELKKQNNWNNYMNIIRQLEYKQMPKYSTVFNFEDQSDKIYLIMKGQVCILLPDNSFENNRYSMEVKRNAQKKLQSLKNKHKELKSIFDQHSNPDFKIKRVYKNPSDDDEDDNDEDDEDQQEDKEEAQQAWGSDASIINLIHPELFCSSVLQQNQHFGEIGVEFHEKRSATVVCKTDCEFAILPSKPYHSMINHRFYTEDKFVTRLRQLNDMFRTMSKAVITLFASQVDVQIYNSNTVIFNIGDKADCIYFIEKGEIEIVQMYHSQDIKPPSDHLELNSSYQDSNWNSISDFQLYRLKAAILSNLIISNSIIYIFIQFVFLYIPTVFYHQLFIIIQKLIQFTCLSSSQYN